jgi:glyceraldehyde-3-phosphate dehydrogenase/erythrose-4-phosphate dehydrogenase
MYPEDKRVDGPQSRSRRRAEEQTIPTPSPIQTPSHAAIYVVKAFPCKVKMTGSATYIPIFLYFIFCYFQHNFY